MSYRSDVEFPGYYLDDESEPLMVGEHDSLKKLYKDIDAYKGSDQNVLVVAETGTGKSLVAHALHHNSPRKDNKYITIDLSNIPEGLIESEMFGSRKGAFTGALDKKGLLEDLKYGTAFLDEIGELPRHLQAKLMRVLEEKKARRVGATGEYDLDVRFIAATSTPRQELRNNDVFHSALFYRLNVLPINIPPLRERGEDIALLIKYFSYKYNKEEGKSVNFDDDARAILNSYKWPGNIRELSGIVRRLVTRYDVVNKEALEMEDEFSGKNDRPYELKDSASPNSEIDNTNPDDIEERLAAFEKRLMNTDAPRSTGESGSKTYSITLSDDLIDLIGSSKERVADRVSNLIRGEKSVEDTTEYNKELESMINKINSKYSKILKFLEKTSSDKQKYTKEFKELQEFVQSYVMGDYPSRKDFNEFRDEIVEDVEKIHKSIERVPSSNEKSYINELKKIQQSVMGSVKADYVSRKYFNKFRDNTIASMIEIKELAGKHEKLPTKNHAPKGSRITENPHDTYRENIRKNKRERKLNATQWSKLLDIKRTMIDGVIRNPQRGMTTDSAQGVSSAPQLIKLLKKRRKKSPDIIDKIKKYLASDFDAGFLREKSLAEWADIIDINRSSLSNYNKESGSIITPKRRITQVSPEKMMESLELMAKKKEICAKAIPKLSKYMESVGDYLFTPERAWENYKRNS